MATNNGQGWHDFQLTSRGTVRDKPDGVKLPMKSYVATQLLIPSGTSPTEIVEAQDVSYNERRPAGG